MSFVELDCCAVSRIFTSDRGTQYVDLLLFPEGDMRINADPRHFDFTQLEHKDPSKKLYFHLQMEGTFAVFGREMKFIPTAVKPHPLPDPFANLQNGKSGAAVQPQKSSS